MIKANLELTNIATLTVVEEVLYPYTWAAGMQVSFISMCFGLERLPLEMRREFSLHKPLT